VLNNSVQSAEHMQFSISNHPNEHNLNIDSQNAEGISVIQQMDEDGYEHTDINEGTTLSEEEHELGDID